MLHHQEESRFRIVAVEDWRVKEVVDAASDDEVRVGVGIDRVGAVEQVEGVWAKAHRRLGDILVGKIDDRAGDSVSV